MFEGFTDFVGPPEDVPEEIPAKVGVYDRFKAVGGGGGQVGQEVRIGKQSTLTHLIFFGIVSLYSVVMKRRRSEEG